MTLLTVDDLARDLKVKNEDLLRELTTMGFEVEGPESPLETDDPAGLRAQLLTILPQREVVEKRIKPTVIRRRMKSSPTPAPMEEPSDRRAARAPEPPQEVGIERHVTMEKAPVEKAEFIKKPPKKIRKPEPARIIEMAPRPATPVVERAEKREALSPREAAQAAQAQPELSTAPVTAAPEEVIPAEITAVSRELSPASIVQTQGEAPTAVIGLEATPEPGIQAPGEETRPSEERPLKKKKKKEKRMQPAQIIGRVTLRKEPPKEPERPAPTPTPPPPRAPERPRVEEKPGIAQPRVFVQEPLSEEEEQKRRKKKEKGARYVSEEKVEEEKLKVRKRKEVVLGADLYDDRVRPMRLRGKGRKVRQRKPELTTPKAIKRRLKLPDQVTVASLAHKMSVKSAEVIQHLFTLGVTASVNENVDFDTATIVASEFGFEAEPLEMTERDFIRSKQAEIEVTLVPRPPVVTVMGHVDHGKTSLLDFIRSTHVTDQEAGGITQHIGAYKIRLDRGELVFLDTPGHEAFTAMRARGAQVTDFVVLVVAADDGVMEQTKEAINHAKAANVPIIVAVNKMDKADADKDRVLRELSEHNLIPESWGGDTLFSYVSAKTGQGIDELMDLILLQAELMELKADAHKRATGTIIEARLDKGKGPVATVLVKDGTLKLGDPFVAGVHFGKVRAMLDHEGRNVESAGPATPVEVHGFSGVPDAGEGLMVLDEEKLARQIGGQRQLKLREQELAVAAPASLEDLLARMQQQEAKELPMIIKADVQGSVEALKEALLGLSAEEIKVKIIHGGVGGVTESDVMLASASRAIIIGFNVRPTPKASQLAEQERVDIRVYSVIYEALEEVRKAMEGMLAPIEKETVTGRAEVRQTFHVAKIGNVAGCYITSGKVDRSSQVRLLRDNVVIYTGRINSMKRFKDDVKEALEGYECGIVLENYRDVKVGDIVEAFVIEKESAKLS